MLKAALLRGSEEPLAAQQFFPIAKSGDEWARAFSPGIATAPNSTQPRQCTRGRQLAEPVIFASIQSTRALSQCDLVRRYELFPKAQPGTVGPFLFECARLADSAQSC
jgi:hypothetical protein